MATFSDKYFTEILNKKLILLITVLHYKEETSVLGSHKKCFNLLAVWSGVGNSVWQSRTEIYRRHFMRIDLLMAFKVNVVVLPCLCCSAPLSGSNICLGLLDSENEGRHCDASEHQKLLTIVWCI